MLPRPRKESLSFAAKKQEVGLLSGNGLCEGMERTKVVIVGSRQNSYK